MLKMLRMQCAFCLVLATCLSLATSLSSARSLEPGKQGSSPKVGKQRMINVTEALNRSSNTKELLSIAAYYTDVDLHLLTYSEIDCTNGQLSSPLGETYNGSYESGSFDIDTFGSQYEHIVTRVSVAHGFDWNGFSVIITSSLVSHRIDLSDNLVTCSGTMTNSGSTSFDFQFCGVASSWSTQTKSISSCIKIGVGASTKNGYALNKNSGAIVKKSVYAVGMDIGCYWANSTYITWMPSHDSELKTLLKQTVSSIYECSHTATNTYSSFLIVACLALFFSR